MSTFSQLETQVMFHKATEMPFSGQYDNHFVKGYYICRNCESKLYTSESKFRSGCGWPAFDDQITGAVKSIPDNDGRRVEIVCNNCGIHLGHVFKGEKLTLKNTRHCVNSASLKFVEAI